MLNVEFNDITELPPKKAMPKYEPEKLRSAAQKQAMVEEAEEPGNTISMVALKYEIHPNQLFRWRKLAHQGALVAVGVGKQYTLVLGHVVVAPV